MEKDFIGFVADNDYEKEKIAGMRYEKQRMINEFYLTDEEQELKQLLIKMLETDTIEERPIIKEHLKTFQRKELKFTDSFDRDGEETINRLLNIFFDYFGDTFPFCVGERRRNKWIEEIKAIGL